MATQEVAVRGGAFSRVQKYLRGVKAEMNKVTWPGKKELLAYTVVVLVAVLVVAVLIWGIDFVFSSALKAFLK